MHIHPKNELSLTSYLQGAQNATIAGQDYELLAKLSSAVKGEIWPAAASAESKKPQRIPEDTPAVFLTPLPCRSSNLAFLATKLILQVALI